MNKKLFAILSIVMVLSLIPISAHAQGDKVQIRWYVGLGAGSDAPVIPLQEAVVEAFNASQNEIELVLEIVDNNQAYDVLSTQIAAGNAPDIVGPMGIRGRSAFPGVWLDLTDLIEANNYDLGDFDPALVDFYKVEGQGQLGIPFGVFPSFFIYNKDLFDEGGVPYPPSAYGEPYVDWNGEEREWNMDTLRDLAMYMTVDINGNDATMEEFDPENIVQFGYHPMWQDLRAKSTIFGAGNLVDADSNATIPDHWRDALEWYHDAMWVDYFVPNAIYGGSDLLAAGGNSFETGNVAMINTHTWYFGWGTANLEADWDLAPVPSYNGVTTAKLHADTFGVMSSTEHPQETFEVLTYLLGEAAEELTGIYGGMPARLSLQDRYLENLMTDTYPDKGETNWDVIPAALAYPDNPNHEEGMPSFLEAEARYNEFTTLADNDPEFDIDAGLVELQADLQAIFDGAAG